MVKESQSEALVTGGDIALFYLIRRLDSYKSTLLNAKGLLPKLIADTGFGNVPIKRYFKTILGEIQIISAAKFI